MEPQIDFASFTKTLMGDVTKDTQKCLDFLLKQQSRKNLTHIVDDDLFKSLVEMVTSEDTRDHKMAREIILNSKIKVKYRRRMSKSHLFRNLILREGVSVLDLEDIIQTFSTSSYTNYYNQVAAYTNII